MADQEPPKKKKRVSFAPDTIFTSSDEGTDSEPKTPPLNPTDAEDGDEPIHNPLPSNPPPGVVAAAQYSASGPNSTLHSRIGSPSLTTADGPPLGYPAGVEVEVPSSPLEPTPVVESPLPDALPGLFTAELSSSPDPDAVRLPSSVEVLSGGSKKRRHDDIDYVSDSPEEEKEESPSEKYERSKAGHERRLLERLAVSSARSEFSLRKGLVESAMGSPSRENSALEAEKQDLVASTKETEGLPDVTGGRKERDVDMEGAGSDDEDTDEEDDGLAQEKAEGVDLVEADTGSEGEET